MATYYAQSSANWDAVSGGTTSSVWNTATDGSGTWLDLSGLVSGATFTSTGDTFDCQSYSVALNVGSSVSPTISVAKMQANSATGAFVVGNSGAAILTLATAADGLYSNVNGALIAFGTGTSSLTVNGDFTYASTNTTGCLRYTTSQTITINGKVTNSSSGYACVGSGSGVLTITNSGGTAVECTGSGRGVYHNSTGSLTITGNVTISNGFGVRVAAAATATITGNITQTAGTSAVYLSGSPTVTITGNVAKSGGSQVINCLSATLSIIGNISSTANGSTFTVGNGTCTWTGARTLSANANCYVLISGGTLLFATASEALTLSCSGVLSISIEGGSLTLTAAGGNASIVRQIADAQIAVLGVDATDYISGPTLPAEDDVLEDVTYGYAGDVQTGTLVAGGGGGIWMPRARQIGV